MINTVKTFTYSNAIVRVHSPNLTEEENKRRMKKIHTAAAELLKETIKNRKGGKTDETNTS